VYDPYDPYFGNSNLQGACAGGVDQLSLSNSSNAYQSFQYTPDWIYNGDIRTDFRMVLVKCARDSSGNVLPALTSNITFTTCSVK